MTNSMQLKTLYDQLLCDSQEDQQAVEELQEVFAKKEACVEELGAREHWKRSERSGKTVKIGCYSS